MLEIKKFVFSQKIPVAVETLHSLCHIEFNAVKCYIDTLLRFDVNSEHRQEFWEDFSQVALEETVHLNLLMHELEARGAYYGALPAHDSLHLRAAQTQTDLLDRLAVVSIVSEGRGMDRGDALVQKMLQANDHKAGAIIKEIVNDERKHVAAITITTVQVATGLKWFNRISREYRQEEPAQKFLEIVLRLRIKQNWKINVQKRKSVGFDGTWLNTFDEWKKRN